MSTTTASQPVAAHQLRDSAKTSVFESPKNFEKSPRLSGAVDAKLSFFDPPANGEKPYNWAGANADNPPNGIPRNFGVDEQTVTINDIRGRETEFSLDNNAFQALPNVPSEMKYEDFNSDETIRRVYYPEVERLLLDHVPGSKRIFLFDHTIRRPNSSRSAVQRVHIDQTPKSAEARVRHHLPEEADTLLQGRYRIINVWRPLNGPVQSNPLAVADSATVNDEDLVPVEHRYPDRTGETAAVKFNKAQKWHYWSVMNNEDRLLLKCYDSDETYGRWGRVPHTAFEDPRTPADAPGRESIEVRALVFG
ncbi:uncharacterized protein PV09_06015 [Verruconis gallopava]|uniref:Methyltransferase n=1 Tax=Verruconis gallopava TaxID=253628 RepID=A0A0D2A7P3_9PEZI|nr:uncharacterized protein PV09_06015 [Verruconis gallopava]KIW02560.1 hypothetical protein PV09_06015 [Verruconis gallopava]